MTSATVPRRTLRVTVCPADIQGCGHARMIWPAKLPDHTAYGLDVAVNLPRRAPERKLLLSIEDVDGQPASEARLLSVSHDGDVVVMQRPSSPLTVQLIRTLQSQGTAVAIDLDDALWAVPRGNTARPEWDRCAPHLIESLRAADLITCSTEHLAAGVVTTHGIDRDRVRVVHNALPALFISRADAARGSSSLLLAQAINGRTTVGWGGHMGVHPRDPQVTGGRITHPVRRTGSLFVAVGGRPRVLRAFGFKAHDGLALCTGPVPFSEWITAMAQLDVSLVPLESTAFNMGKSALKAIESCFAGAVPVMSPTPDNLRVYGLGVGMIARTPQEFSSAVGRLLKDDGMRADMAATGRAVAVASMTVEGRGGLWADAWRAAYDHRQRVGAPPARQEVSP